MSDTSELVPFRARRAPNPFDPRNNADAFEIKLLLRPSDFSDALRLRHRAYADHGHVPHIDGAEYRDAHDDYPTTALFGAYDGGRLVACMRLCFSMSGDALAALPCAPYYPALAGIAANAPHGFVEVSRLAIEPGIGNTSYRATLYGYMVRAALAAARAAGVSRIVVATRPDWVATYKHLLSFEQVGEPALYPPGDMPITLLSGNLEDASKRAFMRNRFFRVSDDDIAHMRRLLEPILHPIQPAVAASSQR
jgi:N-acyl-L-homoserine lactone synthetase